MYNRGVDYQFTATLHDCPTGYALQASNTTFCQANGQWKTPLPRCEGESARKSMLDVLMLKKALASMSAFLISRTAIENEKGQTQI